jgi:MoaA/NifB/PqqE/SkfB family radical SAM enzyme
LATLIQKIKYGSNWNKPYYMYRLASNVFKRRILKQYPLRGIDFSVDYRCNLNCQHCFNKTLSKGEKKMTLQDYARIIKEAADLGAINFAFQGGEFLILDNFEDILRLVDSKRYSLSITTNGQNLDITMVNKLKDIGVNTVTVSLDSGIAEEHDRFRGVDGAFDHATNGIDLTLKAGIKVVINCCITPVSLRSEGFRKLIEFSEERKLLVNTIFAAPSGKWSMNNDIILKKEDIQYYNRLVIDHPNLIRDIDSGYATRGCQGGTESLYITPYGDVLPCPYIHIRAGNIFKENLSNIHQRAMRFFHYQPNCLISENYSFIKEYCDLTSEGNLPLSENYLENISSWN